jgi:hypothetical protein
LRVAVKLVDGMISDGGLFVVCCCEVEVRETEIVEVAKVEEEHKA